MIESFIDRLTRASLRFRWITIALAIVALVAGVIAVTQLKLKFPERVYISRNTRSLFIYTNTLQVVQVVKNDPLSAPHNHNLTYLVGVNPAHMDISDDTIGITQSYKAHVRASVEKIPGNGTDPEGFFIKKEGKYGNIMGGQIPHGIYILSNQAKMCTRGMEVVYGSEITVIHALFYLGYSRIIEESMTHHEYAVPFLRQFYQFLCLLNTGR